MEFREFTPDQREKTLVARIDFLINKAEVLKSIFDKMDPDNSRDYKQ